MNNLGELIKNRREEKGYSLNQLEKTIGKGGSRMTLKRLELNLTKLISFSLLIDISNILDIDFASILVAHGKKLNNYNIKNILKASKNLYFSDVLLDKEKFRKLIEKNLHELT